MGKLMLLGLFLASLDPEYEDGANTARRALLETNMMKQELKDLERKSERMLLEFTGLTKNDLAYAAYAYPVMAGRLSTKPFRKIRYVTEDNWVIRPEVEYIFKDQQVTIGLSINKQF
jgi:hypothetical protein